MDIKHYLANARDVLASGWCQKAFARDVAGIPSRSRAEAACSYCLVGALEKIAAPKEVAIFILDNAPKHVFPEWDRGREEMATTWLVCYNDAPTTKKEDILALIDTALENLE